MRREEIYVFSIESIRPDRRFFKANVGGHFVPPESDMSVLVQQRIEHAKRDIIHGLIFSQSNLVSPEYYTDEFPIYVKKDLYRSYFKFNREPKEKRTIKEIADFIDTNRQKYNRHIKEIRTGYKKGAEAAKEVLNIEIFKTSNLLSNSDLTPDEITKIDEQVIALCGYYSAYEALRSKKTTAKDFPANPFTPLIMLIKNSIRNIDLSKYDNEGIIKGTFFARKGDKIQSIEWSSSRYELSNFLSLQISPIQSLEKDS